MEILNASYGKSSDVIWEIWIKKGVINQLKASSWLDALTLSGDPRLFGEFFDNEDPSNTNMDALSIPVADGA